jgi:regulator of sigma E protease
MSFVSAIFFYGLPFLGVVAVITLVHELGHFIVARWCGVRVEAFSVGFGREIVGWTGREGTRFRLSLLPLGGYVKMFGEQGFIRETNGRIRVLNREERGRSFFHKSVAERAAIVFAGPLVNVVFGFLVIALLVWANGINVTTPTISAVRAGSPAALAGLRAGDRIVSVDGSAVERFEAALAAMAAHPDRPAELVVARGEAMLTLRMASPRSGEPDLGLTPGKAAPQRVGVAGAIAASARITGEFLADNVAGVAEIVSGRRSLDDLAGPVQIAQISGETFIDLGFGALVLLTALLSINIGFVNLLPIPVLDGGHLVFLAIEFFRRRPLSPRVLNICSLGGLFAMLVIFVFVTGHDIARVFG